jgi:hypothetical protein
MTALITLERGKSNEDVRRQDPLKILSFADLRTPKI